MVDQEFSSLSEKGLELGWIVGYVRLEPVVQKFECGEFDYSVVLNRVVQVDRWIVVAQIYQNSSGEVPVGWRDCIPPWMSAGGIDRRRFQLIHRTEGGAGYLPQVAHRRSRIDEVALPIADRLHD